MVAMATSPLALGAGPLLPKPQLYSARRMPVQPPAHYAARIDEARKMLAAAAEPIGGRSPVIEGKSSRIVDVAEVTGTVNNGADAKKARLTPDKLASIVPVAPQRPASKIVAPAPERFGSQPAGSDRPPVMLAYAPASQSKAASAALSAWLASPLDEDPVASQAPSLDTDKDIAVLPDSGDVPLPQFRPAEEQTRARTAAMGKPVEEAEKTNAREASKPQMLAFARPDNPAEKDRGFGQTLRDMFGGGPKAGNGVAVYDISAAKVYMPDGSVLEAHSGVGKMVDDPRYVHVKMSGPTPPHTYNLKMREKRFHGVEAIRMLPVDGKNKFGRDGFLTHSYLLRGGRAESHGCVAFKDYDRFLKAFKQGKVRQLVVVPGGGQERMRLVSNGRRL
ncbi:DUF2778 domain-containing protein [Phyllobacterium salinisoli]|uniref:DUF2778 domain-containing protein n=2 Tax=Phyllobacterium salinisoli TaxID=1899321 RepID=A0A368K111_9HYPH|nr:tlde1 domain-containing protein [Phyllobacterium salinisoli]RCS23069.1 DUF2778 domain-containing protein [Phyllobacterium salinisoli]